MNKIFKVGLIGCGHISETYFKGHEYFNNFQITKCADINMEVANKCAEVNNIEACSVDDIIKDKEIEIILNLTIPKAHYEIAKKSLENGKHIYSEKPMAVNFEDGKHLLQLSKEKGLYIGNAPDTFLGGGIQKSIELVSSGTIGDIKLGNAIFAFPGVQSYHPNPEPWFAEKEGGPVIDMGPYYLTALVNLLGPAKKVHGISTKVFNTRTIGIGPKKDTNFEVQCPTTYLVNLEFENSALIQLTLSFDVIAHQRNHIELYGTKGSIIVPDPNMFGGSPLVCINSDTGEWIEHKTEDMPLGKINIREESLRANEESTRANYRGVGLAEMAYSIEYGKKNRCNGELSLHVLDIIQTTMSAANQGKTLEINTSCEVPSFFNIEDISAILK
jgi:predicted dehydrogenase|tara:strand:- start:87 stop:1247 length:1161 start_codon:yes stop_codon:yes gene_type:complete